MIRKINGLLNSHQNDIEDIDEEKKEENGIINPSEDDEISSYSNFENEAENESNQKDDHIDKAIAEENVNYEKTLV